MNGKEDNDLPEDISGIFQRNDPVLCVCSSRNLTDNSSKPAEMRTGYLPNANLKTVFDALKFVVTYTDMRRITTFRLTMNRIY
jgi:hypothetical protein